jgi:hypothetical protein
MTNALKDMLEVFVNNVIYMVLNSIVVTQDHHHLNAGSVKSKFYLLYYLCFIKTNTYSFYITIA